MNPTRARPACGRTLRTLGRLGRLGLGLAAVAAFAVQGQTTASPARPDPLDPKARVPALTYESTFKAYRRAGDDKPLSWRDANDAVARIGGWRAYAREAQQPDPAASSPAAARKSVP